MPETGPQFNNPDPVIDVEFTEVTQQNALANVDHIDPIRIDIPSAAPAVEQPNIQDAPPVMNAGLFGSLLQTAMKQEGEQPQTAYDIVEKQLGPENMNAFFLASLKHIEKEVREGNRDVLEDAFGNQKVNEIQEIMNGMDSNEQVILQNRFNDAMAQYKVWGKLHDKPHLLEKGVTKKDTTEILKIMFGLERGIEA